MSARPPPFLSESGASRIGAGEWSLPLNFSHKADTISEASLGEQSLRGHVQHLLWVLACLSLHLLSIGLSVGPTPWLPTGTAYGSVGGGQLYLEAAKPLFTHLSCDSFMEGTVYWTLGL